jgi:hypothetical protein
MRLHSATSMIEDGFAYLPTEAGWMDASVAVDVWRGKGICWDGLGDLLRTTL